MTRELITDKSYELVGTTTRTVDIVREVINVVPLYWLTTRVVRSIWPMSLIMATVADFTSRWLYHCERAKCPTANILSSNCTVTLPSYSREFAISTACSTELTLGWWVRYIYLNTEPVNAWFLKEHSEKAAKSLLDDITTKLNETTSIVGTCIAV